MREYGKVYTAFWSSGTTAGLSDDARMLAIYLLTSPHTTLAGMFRIPDGYVSEDLRWPIDRITTAFAELESCGFSKRCARTKWVWIVKHLEWNPPENPNQRKAAQKLIDSVPMECSWRAEMNAGANSSQGQEQQSPNPQATLGEALSQPLGNQEQEQKQEQEHAAQAAAPPVPESAAAPKARAKAAPRQAQRPLPADFAISDRVRQWAAAKGIVQLEQHFEHFVGVARSKGYVYAEWDEALMNAIRANWARLTPPPGPAQPAKRQVAL